MVTGRGNRLALGLCNDRDNPEHRIQIGDTDGGDQDCWNPPGRPRDEQNQRKMESGENSHGDPKPYMLP